MLDIYWVAGNVFRILQTLAIDAYFKHTDMDAIIAKNTEKAKKKYERLGIDPNTAFSDVTNSVQATLILQQRQRSSVRK